MALPTKEQCELTLSFDMVAKTMTVSVQSVISSAGVDGLSYTPFYGTLTDPLGNSVDIDDVYFDGNSGSGSQVFDAPTDSDGLVINGAYDIALPYVTVDDGVDNTTYTDVDSSYTLSYTAPEVCLTAVVNCITPSFVSTDATDYRVTDPTSQGYITPTTVSYSHDLNYPATSNGYPTNVTETSDLIITRGADEFYQGTQTAIVEHSVSYTFVDGLIVTDTLEGDLETKVDCATLLCGVVCGLNKLYQERKTAKTQNAASYNLKNALFISLMADANLAMANIDCGNSDEATSIIADIKSALGNCCDDCSAEDGTPITGVGN